MRRRQQPESTENHERWLVSYADLLTLLFAFFVVMYSLSTASEGSYRILSDSIVSAFAQPRQALKPIQVGELVRSPLPAVDDPALVSAVSGVVPLRLEAIQSAGVAGREQGASVVLEGIATALAAQLPRELAGDRITIKQEEDWLEVDIVASMLFPSGSGVLLAGAVPALQRIAEVLRDLPNAVRIEGHTDNLPIRTELFASNWDLSAARAASVARLFEASGVDPARLSAVALAATQPVSNNASEAGRAQNRRVTLIVAAR